MEKLNCIILKVLWKYMDILDINRVYTNNISEIAAVYGIEAAYCAIKKVTLNLNHFKIICTYRKYLRCSKCMALK